MNILKKFVIKIAFVTSVLLVANSCLDNEIKDNSNKEKTIYTNKTFVQSNAEEVFITKENFNLETDFIDSKDIPIVMVGDFIYTNGMFKKTFSNQMYYLAVYKNYLDRYKTAYPSEVSDVLDMYNDYKMVGLTNRDSVGGFYNTVTDSVFLTLENWDSPLVKTHEIFSHAFFYKIKNKKEKDLELKECSPYKHENLSEFIAHYNDWAVKAYMQAYYFGSNEVLSSEFDLFPEYTRNFYFKDSNVPIKDWGIFYKNKGIQKELNKLKALISEICSNNNKMDSLYLLAGQNINDYKYYEDYKLILDSSKTFYLEEAEKIINEMEMLRKEKIVSNKRVEMVNEWIDECEK